MNHTKRYGLLLFVGLLAASAGFASGRQEVPLLVEASWLEEQLSREGLIVVDYGRSAEDYRVGHIPGAVYLDRRAAYDTVNGVPGMVPPPEVAVPQFEAAGIGNDTRVVIYDAAGGLWASRLFWALELYGHEKVHILNGGFPTWEGTGRPISVEMPSLARATFDYDIRTDLVADTAVVLQGLAAEDVQVVDTRSPAEYAGDDVRAERGGHIPGAINVDWSLAVDGDGSFLSLQELAELYDSAGLDKNKTQITHCQTGVRGAHTYFVLRHLGYKDVRLYDESWVVWGNRDDTPVEAN